MLLCCCCVVVVLLCCFWVVVWLLLCVVPHSRQTTIEVESSDGSDFTPPCRRPRLRAELGLQEFQGKSPPTR